MKAIDSGYAIEQSCLSNTECNALIEALSPATVARNRAGARHLMRNLIVAELSADWRLLAIARDQLGTQAVPFRATLFEKSGRMNWLIPWHQDTALPVTDSFDAPGWTAWSEKGGIVYAHAPNWALTRILALRIHLDASAADNGPLRVFPGSHRCGVLTDREVADYVKRNEHTPCLVSRGGVLAMRPLLIHSSSKVSNINPRRVLHIEYADSLDLSADIRLAVA